MRFGFLLRALLVIALALGTNACATCANIPILTIDAPNGNLRAVAYERTCGNQTRPSIQVSLFEPEHPPSPNAPGNIFASLTGSYIDLRWTDARRLLVVSDAPVARIIKQQPAYKGTSIHYRYPTFQELNAAKSAESAGGTI